MKKLWEKFVSCGQAPFLTFGKILERFDGLEKIVFPGDSRRLIEGVVLEAFPEDFPPYGINGAIFSGINHECVAVAPA